MKKKMMNVLLVTVVLLTVLTGCGEKGNTSDVNQESTQETVVATETPAPAPTPEITPKPTEAPPEQPIPEPEPDVNWAAAYEDFLEREDIIYENMKMTTSMEAEGVSFKIEVATAGDNTYMNFDFDMIGLEMYATKEKIYAHTKMEGQDSWTYATIESEEEIEGLMEMGETVDTDSFTTCEYHKEVIENDIVYDVLYVTNAEADSEVQDAYFYVNRETQKVDKIIVTSEGQEVVINIEQIESIEIPAEALNATEDTAENISMSVFSIIMMGVMSGMEQ